MDIDENLDESGNGASDSDGGENSGANEEDTTALRDALEAVVSGKRAKGEDVNENEEEGDSSSASESSMDDEQMMAIDDKLTEVFKTQTRSNKIKGKFVFHSLFFSFLMIVTFVAMGAQREATHFKNRVLDLVEAFLKRQSSSPLVFRFILPLLELISTSGSDEKQLSDKTTGIIRSRFSKPRDVPRIGDTTAVSEILSSLHERARKSSSSKTVGLVSICSLFVVKALAGHDDQSIEEAYKDSVKNFITKKTSPLTPAFFLDFVRRNPTHGWKLQSHMLGSIKDAANGFRQSQAFAVIQTLYTSIQKPVSNTVSPRHSLFLKSLSRRIPTSYCLL